MTCYTNKATQSKTKKLPFSLVAIKICNSMFVWRQPSPLKLSLASCVAGAGGEKRRGGGRGLRKSGKEREWGIGSASTSPSPPRYPSISANSPALLCACYACRVTVFRLRINIYLNGNIFLLFHAACLFSFTLRWNNMQRLDQTLKRCVWSGNFAGNHLIQACSANRHHVIMPSWLPKAALLMKKKMPLSEPISIQ